MSNEFYSDSGSPGTSSSGSSAAIRTEFAAIEAGFDKMPTLTGNTGKAVVIGSGVMSVTTGTLTLAGNFATSGASSLTLTTTGTTNVTLPTSGTLYASGSALGTPSSGTLTSCTGLPISTGVSGLGTGVATALAVNVGSAGAPVVLNGAGGTPSSLTLTSATGLPIATGVSGLGTSVATALAVNVGSAGAVVVNGGALGTPSSGTGTNITGIPVTNLVSGTLAENVDFALDAVLSADGKYSGIVETGTAGAALSFGELVYRATADSRWEKAKADVAATSSLEAGICVLAAAGDGSATTILKWGKVRADALYPTFTVGAPVYISAATAGLPTSTAPTGTTNFVVRIVGHAEDANTIFFAPSPDYVELA